MDQEHKLIDIADAMGIRVMLDTQNILHPGDLGGWFPNAHVILVAKGLGKGDYLHTLAHELGHAYHGHDGCYNPRQERQADRFAAELLIDPLAYKQAENLYSEHPGAIAAELGVARHTVMVWREIFERKRYEKVRKTHGRSGHYGDTGGMRSADPIGTGSNDASGHTRSGGGGRPHYG